MIYETFLDFIACVMCCDVSGSTYRHILCIILHASSSYLNDVVIWVTKNMKYFTGICPQRQGLFRYDTHLKCHAFRFYTEHFETVVFNNCMKFIYWSLVLVNITIFDQLIVLRIFSVQDICEISELQHKMALVLLVTSCLTNDPLVKRSLQLPEWGK